MSSLGIRLINQSYLAPPVWYTNYRESLKTQIYFRSTTFSSSGSNRLTSQKIILYIYIYFYTSDIREWGIQIQDLKCKNKFLTKLCYIFNSRVGDSILNFNIICLKINLFWSPSLFFISPHHYVYASRLRLLKIKFSVIQPTVNPGQHQSVSYAIV